MPTFKEAAKQYRDAAGDSYRRPDRKKSYFDRGGWHLLTAAGEMVCIVPDGSAPIFGNALNSFYRQLALGSPPPIPAAGAPARR